MRLTRGQNFLLGAIIVSAVVHLILILVIRPRMLSTALDTLIRRVTHRQVTIRPEEREPPPKALDPKEARTERFNSPEVDSEVLMPTTTPLDAAMTDMTTPPPPPEMMTAAPEVLVTENMPTFSEMVHVTDVTTMVAPLAAETLSTLAPPPVRPMTKTELPPPEVVLEPADAPTPEFALAERLFDDTLKPTELKDLRAGLPRAGSPAFVPPEQVMPEVSEKTVSAEKAAVRDLLDLGESRHLVEFVTLGATSAQEGDWTYFRVTIKPKADKLALVPKDVVVLMDASGSIAADRLDSCQKNVRKILRTCTNSGDRFNLVAFRDDFEYAFRSWRPCDKASFAHADRWLGNLAAHGRTDVFSTIRSVLKLPRDPRRPLIALVVTDGEANTGVSKTEAILSQFSALNDGLISVYMYGVKGSANRPLIDVLTHGNRGESLIYDGGSRGKAGDQIVSLSERFRDPVLSDLRVVFSASTPAEAYPRLLRNLYREVADPNDPNRQQQPVELIGRVAKGCKVVRFALKGLNGSYAYDATFQVDLAGAGFDSTLPKRWREEKAIDAKLQ